jgi:hypothetical protein
MAPPWRAALGTALALVLGCEARRAPVLPERPPPSAPLQPSDVPGNGRVRLDVVGAPARVELVEFRDYPWGTKDSTAALLYGGLATDRGERIQPTCDRTPCIIEMPHGSYEFRFTQGDRVDTAFVTFGAVPSLAVHAVGDRKPDSLPLEVLGGLFAATAIIALPLGAGLAATDPPPEVHQDPNDRRTIGLVTLGIGIVAVLGMIPCLAFAPAADRSGPVRQWPAQGAP